jgi:short-subunit dehydrogenase
VDASLQRTALITGAGSGIGRALAKLLAHKGYAIAAIDLREEPLVTLSEELADHRTAWATADVTDRSGLRAAVATLREQLGPADLLVASAGIGMGTPALGFSAETFENIVRVNLIGVANTIEAVLPAMLERKRGHIVGLSSLASFRGLPRMAGYSASKAGLNALLDSFRYELRPHGIAVTAVCPGWVRTPMTDAIDLPMHNLLEPEDVASRIVRAINRRRAYCAFPVAGSVLTRLLGILPARCSDWVLAQMVRGIGTR